MNGRRWMIPDRATLFFATVLASLNVACQRGPEPTLRGLDSLLASQQFDAVEKRLDEFLGVHPDSVQARMLMAQAALNRDPQKPQLALEHLARIRAADRSLRALVKLNEGKAHSALGDYVKAEVAWLDALRANPLVPEAGWALLSLYYLEGRRRETERLGLALHAIEPDPGDRARFLLELVRQDAVVIASPEIIRVLQQGVRDHPDDIHATIALALAHFRYNQPDVGRALLMSLIEREPRNLDFWDALLRGLDEAALPEEIAATVTRVPANASADPRFARFVGVAAQSRREWPASIVALERARQFDPLDPRVVHRLARAYRLTGREADARKIEEEFRFVQAMRGSMLPLYEEAHAVRGFGVVPAPDLYRRIAEARERLGYRAEALAWYRLVLRDRPEDADSLAAAARLADVKLPTLEEVLTESGRGR